MDDSAQSWGDRIYGPFERLVRPLDLPVTPLPASGPAALLWHFIGQFRGILISASLLAVLIEAMNLFLIHGLGRIIDGVTLAGAARFLAEDWPLVAAMGLVLFPLMPIGAYLANALLSQSVNVCLPAAIQWQGHKAVERQDLGFFQDLFAGQVASRLSQVASAVQQQVLVAFQTVPAFLISFLGSIGLLSGLAWPLGLSAALWILANGLLAYRLAPRFVARAKRSAGTRSRLVGAMGDLYSHIALVKQFAAEDSEAGALRRAFTETIDTQQRERRIYLTADSLVLLLNVGLWLAMLGLTFRGLLAGTLSTGGFAAAMYLTQRLSGSSRAFLQISQQIFQALGTIRDAMPVMTTPPTIVDAPAAPALHLTRGAIGFHDLRFGYKPERPVLEGFNLTIAAGEKVGLVGRSGAGKSTLVQLLLRFYDLQAGQITIDGQDIRAVTQASLRAAIGVISQEVALLNRSVGDNIRYGRPQASPAEVEAALTLAAADFIPGLTDKEGRTGLDAHIGERGVKLSGGQRQRLAIARVALKAAPILILDEATSALDSESEAVVQDRLAALMDGRTVLAIAHRLSTIARLDRIIVLDGGRIIEQGRPRDLEAGDGLFAQLWRRQTQGFLGDPDSLPSASSLIRPA